MLHFCFVFVYFTCVLPSCYNNYCYKHVYIVSSVKVSIYFEYKLIKMLEDNSVALNTRTSKKLKDLIQKNIELGTYSNMTEFVRAAIREKLQRDSPELYRSVFEKDEKHEVPTSVRI